METHKINGIELLMPQVPKEAQNIKITDASDLYCGLVWDNHNGKGIIIKGPERDYTILGTCWREGDKLVCEGFDPATMVQHYFREDVPGFPYSNGFKDYLDADNVLKLSGESFNSWLRSEGITIPEGFKRVIIKVN